MGLDKNTLPASWRQLIRNHATNGSQMDDLLAGVLNNVALRESSGATVFPSPENRFRAFHENEPSDVRVVIVGQDCYHGEVKLPSGEIVPEATGLSFSVPEGAKIPPSLRNIFKEMAADLGCEIPRSGDISHWSSQGVLMINTILTVEKDSPKSHAKMGWQDITGAVIQALSKQYPNIVFILWGNDARALRRLISGSGHGLIESSHPSPLFGSCNKGFFGSKPFTCANVFLQANHKQPIQWASYNKTEVAS